MPRPCCFAGLPENDCLCVCVVSHGSGVAERCLLERTVRWPGFEGRGLWREADHFHAVGLPPGMEGAFPCGDRDCDGAVSLLAAGDVEADKLALAEIEGLSVVLVQVAV